MVDGKKMLNILYEDNHLLVVEKPINVLAQSDKTNDIDLLTMLKEYIKQKYNKPGNVYLGLVHRLDRVVGGVMVFAKTSKSAARLSKQISLHQMEKIYYAVVCGEVTSSGRLENYLEKDPKTNTSYVSSNGKLSILNYEVMAVKNNFSLLKIILETGRHHQIRVQFQAFSHPLYGDAKYNPNYKRKEQIALFAKELSFFHPITKEKLHFSLPFPARYPYTLFKEEDTYFKNL